MSDQPERIFPISRFEVPALAHLPEDLRAKIDEIAEKSGFVPNVFMALARRPDELRAFFAYYDALMLREGGLSKAEKEMIVVATSAANRCPYCVVSHGALLRIFSKNPRLGEQVAVLYEKADITFRQRVMLDAAMVLAREPWAFGEREIERLKAEGFSEDDVWDIGAITAFFALSNRMAHLTDMRPNDDFYLMGRLPREKGEPVIDAGKKRMAVRPPTDIQADTPSLTRRQLLAGNRADRIVGGRIADGLCASDQCALGRWHILG